MTAPWGGHHCTALLIFWLHSICCRHRKCRGGTPDLWVVCAWRHQPCDRLTTHFALPLEADRKTVAPPLTGMNRDPICRIVLVPMVHTAHEAIVLTNHIREACQSMYTKSQYCTGSLWKRNDTQCRLWFTSCTTIACLLALTTFVKNDTLCCRCCLAWRRWNHFHVVLTSQARQIRRVVVKQGAEDPLLRWGSGSPGYETRYDDDFLQLSCRTERRYWRPCPASVAPLFCTTSVSCAMANSMTTAGLNDRPSHVGIVGKDSQVSWLAHHACFFLCLQ